MAFLLPLLGAPTAVPIVVVAFNPYAPGVVPLDAAAHASFAAVDTDKNGVISWQELRTALQAAFGPCLGSTARLLVRVNDKNGSGVLEYPEYEVVFGKLKRWREWFDARKESGTSAMDTSTTSGAGSSSAASDAARGWISVRHLQESLSSLGLPIDERLAKIIIQDYLPEDGGDRVRFPEVVRLFSEMDALAEFTKAADKDKGPDGRLLMSPQMLCTAFFACRG